MRCSRRRLLQTAAAAPFAGAQLPAQGTSKAELTKLSIPGLFPGRVVGVEDKRSIVSGQYQAAVVKTMMERGMKELTGADWVESWKLFFKKATVSASK